MAGNHRRDLSMICYRTLDKLFILMLNNVTGMVLICGKPISCSKVSVTTEFTITWYQVCYKIRNENGQSTFQHNVKKIFSIQYFYIVINFFKVEKGAHSMFIFGKSLLNKRFETHKMVIFIRISTLFESTLYFRQFDSRDHTRWSFFSWLSSVGFST